MTGQTILMGLEMVLGIDVFAKFNLPHWNNEQIATTKRRGTTCLEDCIWGVIPSKTFKRSEYHHSKDNSELTCSREGPGADKSRCSKRGLFGLSNHTFPYLLESLESLTRSQNILMHCVLPSRHWIYRRGRPNRSKVSGTIWWPNAFWICDRIDLKVGRMGCRPPNDFPKVSHSQEMLCSACWRIVGKIVRRDTL